MLGIPIEIMSSAVRLEISAIASGNKKYKSIIKKEKRKHNKIALSAKSKLNRIQILISKALTDSSISHDEFVLINNILKKYYRLKVEIRYLKAWIVNKIF